MQYWWILDYENCKCRKKLVDKLIGECTETIEETKLANITFTENNYEHNSCMVYAVLMIVVFIIFTGIAIYFVYHNWSWLRIVLIKKH